MERELTMENTEYEIDLKEIFHMLPKKVGVNYRYNSICFNYLSNCELFHFNAYL